MKNLLSLLPILLLSFFTLQSFGQQWELQHPRPQAHDLTDITFLDAENGWTGGAYGTLMKTSDGGQNWSLVEVPTEDWIVRLLFINPDKGWVTTFEGEVFYTEDQGATWVLSDYSHFLDIHFINNEIGFVLGYFPDNSGCLIYRTENGGASWEEFAQFEGYYMSDLEFVSDTKAWLSGIDGVLFYTENAGVDWELQELETEMTLYNISFSDTLNGWTAGSEYVDDEEIATVFHTSDGGQTWNVQFNINDVFITWMDFESEMTGYLLGGREEDYELKPVFFRTTDGGAHWDSIYLGDVDLLNRGVLKDGGIWLTGDIGRIMYSGDQANTWEDQVEILSSSILTDVFFIDDQTGWTVGNGAVLKTENGGATWTKLNTEIDGYWESVSFVDEQHGWIAAEQLLATSNGGQDWTPLNAPVEYIIKEVVFTSLTHGWIIADGDNIYSTQDGGVNWDYHAFEDVYPRDIHFVNADKGFIVGDDLIFSTADGGQNWATYDLDNYGNLVSIYFIDNQYGWALDFGPEGIYYQTQDGGATWEGDTIPGANFLLDLHFVNPLQGWVVGVGGFIWYTEDGGITWEQQEAYTDLNLFSVHAVTNGDVAYAWVTGFNGMILHSTVDLIITDTESPAGDLESLLRVFPNPAKEELHVLLPDDLLIYDAEICNYLGQVVKRLKISGPNAMIPLGDLSPGQYLLSLHHGSEKYTTKMLVLK